MVGGPAVLCGNTTGTSFGVVAPVSVAFDKSVVLDHVGTIVFPFTFCIVKCLAVRATWTHSRPVVLASWVRLLSEPQH